MSELLKDVVVRIVKESKLNDDATLTVAMEHIDKLCYLAGLANYESARETTMRREDAKK